jgi:aldose 1-epimerase
MTPTMSIISRLLLTAAALTSLVTTAMSEATLERRTFGKIADGRDATLFSLQNGHGVTVEITNLGGAIVRFLAPDRDGKSGDIVLGLDTAAGYQGGHPFFGVIAGRYANRIAKGKFSLDGKDYTLAINNGPNSLHGGKVGFDKKLWDIVSSGVANGVATLVLKYVSPDGEEGYPGTLSTTLTYALDATGALQISYAATTDKPTVVNLTNHSYFNLGGHQSGDILKHTVRLHAGNFTATDADLIPTGEILPVAGTPLDFTKPMAIGERIKQHDFLPLAYGKGYDHNFVIDGAPGKVRIAAIVTDPVSGRTLECSTDAPGVQLYTMNHVSSPVAGKSGAQYAAHSGFCLETQHYPDSPNHPTFPTTTLRPGETYRHTTIYKVGTVANP